jgi:choline dehydrogenase-like flavoprotein
LLAHYEQFAPNSTASKKTVHATKEVILAAGALHTPQLLQISGIGDERLLSNLGINVVVDLPGVGQNYQDHPLAYTVHNCESRFCFYLENVLTI